MTGNSVKLVKTGNEKLTGHNLMSASSHVRLCHERLCRLDSSAWTLVPGPFLQRACFKKLQ
ncbi:hypothetical protein ACRRTK_000277 [Alexandromys fortis]